MLHMQCAKKVLGFCNWSSEFCSQLSQLKLFLGEFKLEKYSKTIFKILTNSCGLKAVSQSRPSDKVR